jgi:hypothetical protein
MHGFAILADIVVVVHLCYVCFALGGQIAVLLGAFAGWRWTRNPWFRFAHLASVILVAVQPIVGAVCPLTEWEYWLRESAGQGVEEIPFIARLARSIIFYDLPGWVFTTAYMLFALIVAVTFILIPPLPLKKNRFCT